MILQKLKAIIRHRKHRLFTRPFELNIVGMRSDQTTPNRFDDEIHVFYKVNAHRWNYHVFKATTDPGTFWLRNPMQAQGTAILAEGQYVDAFSLGLHRGQYTALVQEKPVTVIRDYDRDALLDFYNGTKAEGIFGINIHRANREGITLLVDKNSAGCQVFENAESYERFMLLCEMHRSHYGNRFTYTLIDFRALRRGNYRLMAAGLGLLGLIALALSLTKDETLKSIADKITETFLEQFKQKTPFTHEN